MLRALPLRQGQDGKGGHQERYSSALNNGQTDAPRGLEVGNDARDEDHRRDDDAPVGVLIGHAQRRRQDERYGNNGSNHGQVVLECEEDAQVPWGIIVDGVEQLRLGFLITWRRVSCLRVGLGSICLEINQYATSNYFQLNTAQKTTVFILYK